MNEIEIYKSPDNTIELQVNLDDETVWLTQKQMGELFGKNRVTVTEHIGNVFKEGELKESSVCRKFRHTAKDGKSYEAQYYNLDVIISVGYRVKSKQGTQFRQWATPTLKRLFSKGLCHQRKKVGRGREPV